MERIPGNSSILPGLVESGAWFKWHTFKNKESFLKKFSWEGFEVGKHPKRDLQLDSYQNYCDIKTKQEYQRLIIWGEERLYMRSHTAGQDWYLVSSIDVRRTNERTA